MWKDNNDKIYELWSRLHQSHKRYPCQCPICGYEAAHIYIRRYKDSDNRGAVWMWCSECKEYSHCTVCTPKWWANDDFVDLGKLLHTPDYLESIREQVDNHINKTIDDYGRTNALQRLKVHNDG